MRSGFVLCWLGGLFGISLSVWEFWHPALILGFLFCALCPFRRLICISAGLGSLIFFLSFERLQERALRLEWAGPQFVQFCEYSPSSFGSVVKITEAQEEKYLGRKFYFSKRLDDGACIRAEVSFRNLSSSENPGFPPQELKRELQGPVGSIRLVNKRPMASTSPKDIPLGEAFERSLLFGEVSALPQSLWASARRLGLIHLFVVSGMHISWILVIIQISVSFLFRKFRIYSPYISALLIFAYIFGFELGIPAQRAGLFFMFAFIAPNFFSFFRRYSALERCAQVGLLFLILNPLWVFSPTYLFSFGACTVLALEGKNILKSVNTSFFSCILCGVLLYPIFPISILCNLIFIPLFAFVLFPSVLLGWLFKGFQHFREVVCELFLQSWVYLEKLSFELPPFFLSPHQSLFMLLGLGVLLKMRKFIRFRELWIYLGFLAASLWLPDFWNERGGSHIEFLDVGQGDGIVMKLQNKRVLIDGGKHPFWGAQLQSRGIRQIDLWILSHFDADHIQNFLRFARDFQVKEVWIPRWDKSSTSMQIKKLYGHITKWPVPGKNLRFSAGPFTLNAQLAVNAQRDKPVRNKDSLIVEFRERGNLLGLFLGDLPGAQEKSWLQKRQNQFQGSLLFLKVAHHGSSSSTSKEILQALRPKLGIVSVGRGNSYRFPHSSVLDRLERVDATIIRTDTFGSIKINLDFWSLLPRMQKFCKTEIPLGRSFKKHENEKRSFFSAWTFFDLGSNHGRYRLCL